MSHDRTDAHRGSQDDLVVVLAAAVGTNPTGTDLHTVLAWLNSQISLREATTRATSSFMLDAIGRKTVTGSFTLNGTKRTTVSGSALFDAICRSTPVASVALDAIVRQTATGSYAFDATLSAGVGTGTYTLDGILSKTTTTSFSLDAIERRLVSATFTLDSTVMPSFTLNAVLATSGLADFQSDAFQNDAFN